MVIYVFMISIVLCAFVFVVGILFRVAGALRLSVPLLYCFIVAFFMPGWSTSNPELCYGILYGLVGLVVLSWVITLIRKIGEYRAQKEIEQWEAEMALEQLKRKQGLI